ncbi:MAG: SIMPL domain-containing protein [Clostridia bacterium]|nr:SIMPL domain-containing protein [Clostridia bacterium]
MKNLNKLVAVIAVFILAVSAFINTNVNSYAETEKSEKTIEVSGKYIMSVKPDIAEISLGVKTEAKDAKVAQSENAKKMSKVIASIKKLGIKEEDIKTSNYSIYPRYEWRDIKLLTKEEERRVLIGYEVSNTVRITVRDLTKVSNVIDDSVKAGANFSNNINFKLADNTKYYNEALKEALKKAKVKAETLAGVYQIKLGAPKKIVETGYNEPGIFRYSNALMSKSVVMEDAVATPIESGEITVEAEVNVVYEY